MTKIADKTYLFEQMPVRKALLKQIVPAVISQMIVLIYSLADTYFVGLLNDPRQTAAVTVVSSAFLMLTAVSNLFAVGAPALRRARSDGGRTKRPKIFVRFPFGARFWLRFCFHCFFGASPLRSCTFAARRRTPIRSRSDTRSGSCSSAARGPC